MVGCVEGILGLRPDFYGLKISPTIPKEWESLEIEKEFRGKHLHIVINNPGHVESGCVKLTVDGKEVEESYIPAELLKEQTEIELMMS
jgi:cellobiose phosphorylase